MRQGRWLRFSFLYVSDVYGHVSKTIRYDSDEGDIAKALASYPDPRLVLGDVYRGNGSGIGGMWQTGDLNDVDNFDYSLKNDLNYMMPESRFFQLKQLD